MSEWRDRHAGSQTVALTRALVELLSKLPDPKSDKERDDQQRLRAGIEVARAIILSADPQLLSARIIDAPSPALSQVQNATSAYVSSGDAAQLTSANAYLEQVLDALTTWLQRPAREARQTIAALRRDVEEVLEDLRGEAGRNRDRAAELEQALARVRSEIEQLVDQATAEAQSALAPLAARQTELTAEISNQKSRLDAAIAQFQSQFSTAESQRAEQFATADCARGRGTRHVHDRAA